MTAAELLQEPIDAMVRMVREEGRRAILKSGDVGYVTRVAREMRYRVSGCADRGKPCHGCRVLVAVAAELDKP